VPPRSRLALHHHGHVRGEAQGDRRQRGPPARTVATGARAPEAARDMISPTRLIALAAALAALSGCGRSFVPATPSGFVDLGDNYPNGEYRATTADGVVIGIRAWDNEPKGELAFWARALERRMRDMGGYALLEKKGVTNRGHLTGVEMRFGHDEG